MANVSVEMTAVVKAISLCKQSIQQCQKSSEILQKKYQAAGTSWKDGKYKELGGVLGNCTKALNSPVSELENCVTRLESLKKAISEYESTKIK